MTYIDNISLAFFILFNPIPPKLFWNYNIIKHCRTVEWYFSLFISLNDVPNCKDMNCWLQTITILCMLWQSTRGKWWLTHWASLLRWIWSISVWKMWNGIVHHKSDRKTCVLPTADRNTCYNYGIKIRYSLGRYSYTLCKFWWHDKAHIRI